MKILLVDDDEASMLSLKIALKQRGYEVTATTNGKEALDLMERGEFQWLVSDAHMSPYHGGVLADAAARCHPRIKTVIISGVCEEGDMADWPVSKVFKKPIDIDELVGYLNGKIE